eukprot:tig00000711_g3436.t1
MATKEKVWLPLESNPEVMNKFLKQLGVTTDAYSFTDILGTDPDLLAMVPQPVLAVLLLFPLSAKIEAAKDAFAEGATRKHDEHGLLFIKQTIGNACGTIGLLHATANNADALSPAGYLKNFMEKARGSTPQERAAFLQEDDEIEHLHEALANEGQSEVPEHDEDVDLHFVAFLHRSGGLYEMDGRAAGPLYHGPTTPETLLQDAVKAIEERFMRADPDQLRFGMVALAPALD